MLLVLSVMAGINAADTGAFALVLQNIKTDVHLSDTQLGVLTGLAFALFYSLMGVPIARWADRGNRVRIISIAALLWAVPMALLGWARTFYQLLALRVGTAVGEAGLVPPSHSLIADHFNREERPRAVAFFSLGTGLGGTLGFLAAGWLSQFYGWRNMFAVLSLPGIVMGIVAWTTLKDPRRTAPAEQSQASLPPLRQVGALIWKIGTFRHLLLASALLAIFSNGMLRWLPTFFVRTYGLKTGELGTWFALITGVGGLAGLYAGGALASGYAAGNEQLQLRVGAIGYCAFTLVTGSVFLTSNLYVALALTMLVTTSSAMVIAPVGAMVQTLVPPRMRATFAALVLLVTNLIGGGLGPLLTAVLSDALRPSFGEDSLRYALAASCPGFLWVAWHLRCASRCVMDDLARADLRTADGPLDQQAKRAVASG